LPSLKPSQDKNKVWRHVKKVVQVVQTCASKKVEGNLIPSCCECGEIIDNDTKAVQCEKCVENETWKCASCLDLSDEMYDQLATSTKSNLHWFCPKCENIVLNADVSSPNIQLLNNT